MSEIESLQHLSPLRSEVPARFLLYTISSMPRFSTFHNKSLDRIGCGLAALERLYSLQQRHTHTKKTHNQTLLPDGAAPLQNSTTCYTFEQPPLLSRPTLCQEAYHMTTIKEDIRKLQSTFLILHHLPPPFHLSPPPPQPTHTPFSLPLLLCESRTGFCMHLNSNHLLLEGKLYLLLRFLQFLEQPQYAASRRLRTGRFYLSVNSPSP